LAKHGGTTAALRRVKDAAALKTIAAQFIQDKPWPIDARLHCSACASTALDGRDREDPNEPRPR